MGKLVDLAIVVPTLNEENYIGNLLDSINKQTVQPKEIVIVDAFSKDKTEAEVKKFKKKLPQLKFIQIPKYSISRQRNAGARKTKASHILFLDADTVLLDADTLEKYFQEVKEKDPGLAVAGNYPLSDHWKDKVLFQAANIGTKAVRDIYPLAVAINLYIRRDIFETLGGFDEKVKLGEDCELVQRYAKEGLKYIVLEKPRIFTSVRRLRKEGRIGYIVKSINSLIGTEIYGYRKNPIIKEYEFGKHGPADE
jgi:glycosyltransferase involved in cell wall biosynthesis